MKKLSAIIIILLLLTSCGTEPNQSELIRTGEYYTSEQMESIKSLALNVQEAVNLN